MQKNFKILTFISIFTCIIFLDAYAASVKQNKYNTHLRWTFDSNKKQLKIEQDGPVLYIKTLNADLFNKIRKDFVTLTTEFEYIKSFEFNSKPLPYNPAVITVQLKDSSVELFSFYKDSEKKLIVDFWINKDLVVKKPEQSSKLVSSTKVKKVVPKRRVKKKKKVAKRPVKAVKKTVAKKKATHRDFRYGSSFLWDYAAFVPSLKKDVDTNSKAPNYFYAVKDRKFEGSKKETHMQLSINFYKKSQWGLMTKSIDLYEKKYGKDGNKEINDFMKSVALIKNLLNPKVKIEDVSKEGTFQAAINILSSIAASTQDYKLAKASSRYTLQAALDKQDYIKSLQIGKQLYVLSTEQFDDDMIILSSKAILHSLAQLKQLDKIKEFLSNKAVIRVLPKQVGHAYTSFVNLALGKEKLVVREFEKKEKGIIGSPHPAILYNTAESYFRLAQYAKAKRLYDQYISNYSFIENSSQARLRLAVCYDLLNEGPKKVRSLYRSAINKSSLTKVRYEAKVRYIGFNLVRKLKTSEADQEEVVFLDQTVEERKAIDKNLRRLLWLTRLRLFLSSEKYQEALAYLSTIPLDAQPSLMRSVFIADGKEAVFGVIKKAYLGQEYTKAIKNWEVYRDKYVQSVGNNSYLKYIVTDSYLKLGLMKSFKQSLAELKKMTSQEKRSFPIWVLGHKQSKIKDYIVDLNLLKNMQEKDFAALEKTLEANKANNYVNYNFYKSVVSFERRKYNNTVSFTESLLLDEKNLKRLSPSENQMMLKNYIEALYEVGSGKKFRKNVSALIGDLRKSKGRFNPVIQRAEYLVLESMFSDKKGINSLLEKTNSFLKAYKKSLYNARVRYIKGIALLRNKKEKEGKEILSKLLEEKDTPEYLKGLARSELTTLVLKNRQL